MLRVRRREAANKTKNNLANRGVIPRQRGTGGLVTREQEAAIVDAWLTWSTQKRLTSEDYLDFYETVVRRTKALRRLHVFEVLDVVMSTEYTGTTEARRSA